jgi:hypothetical protein
MPNKLELWYMKCILGEKSVISIGNGDPAPVSIE